MAKNNLMSQRTDHNKEEPLFFLITCVKDGRQFINKLFDSLIKQSRINFVHYIYEDGSAHPLDELVDDYKLKVSLLKKPYQVFYEKNPDNVGLNMATISCIKKCNCKFFIWIDCDNWVDEHFFEELEKLYLQNKKAVVLRSKRFLINSTTKEEIGSNDEFFYRNSITTRSGYDKYLIFGKYYYSFFAVNYEFYRSVNPEFLIINDKSFFNDQQVIFACSKNHKRFAFTEKAIGYCLIRRESESASYYLPDEKMILFFEMLNQKLHINKLDYSDCKECISLAKTHKELFDSFRFVEARRILTRKRRLFRKNNIKNIVFPFCENSIFSMLYYCFPRVASCLALKKQKKLR